MAIDEVGNTPIMFFLMIEDFIAVNFILSYCKDVDLSIKNKNGISASALALKIKDENVLIDQIFMHQTFDKQFVDPYNNNLLMYSVLTDNPYMFIKILNENPKSIAQVNNNKENFVILATKLGFLEKVNNYAIRDANF
ncbi:hypothetical protein PIROE2DRAFT_66711, partial [Piromyces sp. E2]